MKWAKILIVVITSVWFFPVNCSGALFAGTILIAKLDARDVGKGEPVHSQFSFVVETGDKSGPYLAAHLSELPGFKEKIANSVATGTYSFLMTKSVGSITSDNSKFTYQVIEETTSGQIIEVIEHYQDGDNTIWSRYKATESGITPTSSRMFYFGYMFGAFPYAFGFALFVYGAGRFLEYRNRTSGEANGGS